MILSRILWFNTLFPYGFSSVKWIQQNASSIPTTRRSKELCGLDIEPIGTERKGSDQVVKWKRKSDLCRESLEKQILQLKQENHILEEANARYSSLQVVEAQVGIGVFL